MCWSRRYSRRAPDHRARRDLLDRLDPPALLARKARLEKRASPDLLDRLDPRDLRAKLVRPVSPPMT